MNSDKEEKLELSHVPTAIGMFGVVIPLALSGLLIIVPPISCVSRSLSGGFNMLETFGFAIPTILFGGLLLLFSHRAYHSIRKRNDTSKHWLIRGLIVYLVALPVSLFLHAFTTELLSLGGETIAEAEFSFATPGVKLRHEYRDPNGGYIYVYLTVPDNNKPELVRDILTPKNSGTVPITAVIKIEVRKAGEVVESKTITRETKYRTRPGRNSAPYSARIKLFHYSSPNRYFFFSVGEKAICEVSLINASPEFEERYGPFKVVLSHGKSL